MLDCCLRLVALEMGPLKVAAAGDCWKEAAVAGGGMGGASIGDGTYPRIDGQPLIGLSETGLLHGVETTTFSLHRIVGSRIEQVFLESARYQTNEGATGDALKGRLSQAELAELFLEGNTPPSLAQGRTFRRCRRKGAPGEDRSCRRSTRSLAVT